MNFRFFNHRLFSALLNFIGLTLAFSAFLVIMVQVVYDYGYDRNYEDAERIFRVENKFMSRTGYSTALSRPMIEAMKSASPEIEAGGCYNYTKGWNAAVTLSDDVQQNEYRIRYGIIEKSLLKVFPFDFITGDTSRFEPFTVIISESTAKLLFGDESAVGKNIYLDKGEQPYMVAAVYKDFPENSSADCGIFSNMGDSQIDNWSEWNMSFYVKLRSPQAAGDVATAMLQSLMSYYDAESWTEEEMAEYMSSLRLVNLHDAYYSTDVEYDNMGKGNRFTTITCFTVSLLIIIVAIINFINFSMASVPFMIKGINTRRVLGATRGRLIGRQVGESLLIAVAAFILSVIVMRTLSGTLVASMISGSLDPADNLALTGAGAAISLIMVALAGIFSASYSTSFPPAMVLKGSFSLSAKGRSLRSIIVGFQYVVSFILIIMTLFIYCQRRYMNSFDMGFDRDQIVTFYVGNSVGERRQAFEAHLKENPHVLDVTFAGNELVSNGKMGWGRMYDGENVNIDCLPVDADFIDFFGMEVVQGRDFMSSDEMKSNGTFIMNEAAMEAYPFLKLDTKLSGHADEPADIVGVVRDFNFKPLQYGVSPIALYVFGSDPWWPLTWAYARISPEDVAGTMDYIRQSVSEFNPQMTADYVNVRFLDEAIGNLYQKETNLNKLITIASVLSLLICVIGILGLVYFETQFRRKEIALRRVHGATVGEVLRMINRYYVIICTVCFIVAAPLAWFIARKWVEGFTYQCPVHAWIFIVAYAALLAITVGVVTLQSHRAVSKNPVDSIKNE